MSHMVVVCLSNRTYSSLLHNKATFCNFVVRTRSLKLNIEMKVHGGFKCGVFKMLTCSIFNLLENNEYFWKMLHLFPTLAWFFLYLSILIYSQGIFSLFLPVLKIKKRKEPKSNMTWYKLVYYTASNLASAF